MEIIINKNRLLANSIYCNIVTISLITQMTSGKHTELNGCIRNTTVVCGNVATGLLLRPRKQ